MDLLESLSLEVCLSIFLKSLSVVMSVVEPFVWACDYWVDKNLGGYGKRPCGAGSTTSHIAIIIMTLLLGLVGPWLGSYTPTISRPMPVKRPFRHDLSHKNQSHSCFFLTGISVRRFPARNCLECLATVLLTNRSGARKRTKTASLVVTVWWR